MAEGVGGLGGSGGGVVEEVCWGDGGYDFVVPGWEDVCVDFEAELEGEEEDGEEGGFGYAEGFAWRGGVVYLGVVGGVGGVGGVR